MCEYLGSDSQNVRIKNHRPNISMNTESIKAALANLDQNAALCDLPDSEFVTGGAITTACREAGYDESGRATINQLNVWSITVGELEAMLCESSRDQTLRISKIFPYGDRMVAVSHSEGMTRIALEWEHFEEDLTTINDAGYAAIEEGLKQKTGCNEIEWAK